MRSSTIRDSSSAPVQWFVSVQHDGLGCDGDARRAKVQRLRQPCARPRPRPGPWSRRVRAGLRDPPGTGLRANVGLGRGKELGGDAATPGVVEGEGHSAGGAAAHVRALLRAGCLKPQAHAKQELNVSITSSGFETCFGWDRWNTAPIGAGIRQQTTSQIQLLRHFGKEGEMA